MVLQSPDTDKCNHFHDWSPKPSPSRCKLQAQDPHSTLPLSERSSSTAAAKSTAATKLTKPETLNPCPKAPCAYMVYTY